MLARGVETLVRARARERAVPAFTVYSLEAIRAIRDAAESTGLPVIVSAGSSSFRAVGAESLAAAALAAADAASVPAGVHLDHATDLDEIARCIDLGYTSVMFDGSALDFDENVRLTRQVVERAHAAGVWVEAELAGVPGDEDASSDAAAGELTDPEQAAEFVERTGVDVLAAAVGTVHGLTTVPMDLDVERIRQIAAVTRVPLALHGASGLTTAELQAAVGAGIAKVNFNAELRRAAVDALAAALPEAGDDVPRLQRASIAAMQAVAEEKLRALAGKDAP
jgi:ketose-bisphosphate aldolase